MAIGDDLTITRRMLRYYIRSNKWTHTYKSDRKSFIKLIVRDGINTISNSFMCSHYFKGNDSKCVHNIFFSLLFCKMRTKWDGNVCIYFIGYVLTRSIHIHSMKILFVYKKNTQIGLGNELRKRKYTSFYYSFCSATIKKKIHICIPLIRSHKN